jgi:hypothetical protein
MPEEFGIDEPVRDGRPRRFGARQLAPCVFLVAVAATAGLLGFVTGSDYGDLFAPAYRILGLEGYIATRWIGALTCAACALTLTALALVAFPRRRRAALLTVVGVLMGQFLTEPLLFSLLPPHHGVLPLAYLGTSVVGGAVGAALGAVSSRRRRTKPDA